MHLDIRTETVVATLAAFGVSVLYILLWRARRTYPGFGQWTASLVSLTLSLMALALRGPFPLAPSVVVTNAASFLSQVLLLEGTRKFIRLPHRPMLSYGIAGAALSLQVFFLAVIPSEPARIMVSSGLPPSW
jgi:hypothetical protein